MGLDGFRLHLEYIFHFPDVACDCAAQNDTDGASPGY
jgi:hypothetical protein